MELYYSILANLVFKNKGKLKFLKLSRAFKELEEKLPYLKEEDKSKKILRFGTFKQMELEKIAIALRDLLGKPFTLSVNGIYKLKALKV